VPASEPTTSDERELVIHRTFAAPRALVYEVWTRPEHIARWWGPADFTVPHYTMDARPGGGFRVCLRAPDGTDHWAEGTYRELAPPARLVFTWAWDRDQPRVETVVTIDLADEGDRTHMTFRHGRFPSRSERDGHNEGWSECFDKLPGYLAELAR
jgi:uncharacterized protein YndB with AHSA1/START domain